MTSGEVLRTHRKVFYRAPLEQKWDALASLYSDHYTLIRGDGSVLTKAETLDDLRAHNLIFERINFTNETVRIVHSVAVLTGESRSRATHGGHVPGVPVSAGGHGRRDIRRVCNLLIFRAHHLLGNHVAIWVSPSAL